MIGFESLKTEQHGVKRFEAYPPERINPEHLRALDAWRPGQPIPDFAQIAPAPRDDVSEVGSGIDLREVRRGPPRQQVRREYARGDAHAVRQQRVLRNAQGQWACPVCPQTFNKANQAAFHYEEHHAISDPSLVTVQVSIRFVSGPSVVTQTARTSGETPPFPVGGPARLGVLRQCTEVFLFTDGSGGEGGAGVFPLRSPGDPWVAALYGPVITVNFDPVWMGATQHTNNTAELSAIGEGCRRVLDELAMCPNLHKVHILYDSVYAYSISTRLAKPTENQTLAETVACLVDKLRARVEVTFEHVRGHRGIHGNEVADRLADWGARGRVSPHCDRWVNPPAGPMAHPLPVLLQWHRPCASSSCPVSLSDLWGRFSPHRPSSASTNL